MPQPLNVGDDRRPAESAEVDEQPLPPSTRGPGEPFDRTVRMTERDEEAAENDSAAGDAADGDQPGDEEPAAGERNAALLAAAAEATGLEVLEVLGRGGMGVVLKARDPRLDRIVAVKLPVGGALTDPAAAARFRTEAKAIASVQHPHVAAVYDVGGEQAAGGSGDGDTPFLVMEYLPGGTLADRANGEPQTPRDAARLMATLARAAAALHDRGVLHRDLKPANVMFAAAGTGLNGTPKIGDFGLAKRIELPDGTGAGGLSQTKTGEILGTPSYMAPEQAGGVYKLLGPPCDVYALGAILYELLTGRPPFRGADVLQTVLQVLSDDPVPPRRLTPATPRDLETICLKCLAKPPRKRYATATELADDLDRWLNGEPIAARPAGRVEKAVRWARRYPARAALVAVTALSLLALISGGLWYNAQLREELDRSTRLVDSGRGLAQFLTGEHLRDIQELSGATGPRGRLAEELVVYLNRVASVIEERPDAEDAPLALELAEAFNQVGAVQFGTGGSGRQNVAAALKAYESADELLDLAAAAAENSGDRATANDVRQKRVMLRQNQAEAYYFSGRYDDALVALQDADRLLRQIADDGFLAERSLRILRAEVWIGIASNRTRAGRPDAAVEGLDVADRLIEQAAKAPPEEGEDPNTLAVMRGNLASERGVAAVNRGDLPAAREAFERSLPLQESVAQSDPDNDVYAANLSTTLRRLSGLDFQAGDDATAIARLHRAETIHRQRIERDPENARAQSELLKILEILLQFTPGEPAVTQAREAVALADRLAARDGENRDAAFQRVTMRDTLGAALANVGRWEEAFRAYRETRELAQSLSEQAGGDPGFQRVAAQSLIRIALIRIQSGGEVFESGKFDPPAVVEAAEQDADRAIAEFAPLVKTGPGLPTPSADLLAQAELAKTLRDYCRDQPYEVLADMAVMRGEPRPRTPLIAPKPSSSSLETNAP